MANPPRPSATRRPTSVDVARSAGVSQATVSLVLNGQAGGRVSETTRLRVKHAAEVLGYRPNAAARTLRLGRARTVALVVPDVRNPYFAAVLRGATQAAREADYTVVLLDTDNQEHWQARARGALAAGALDGFVLCDVEPPRGKKLAEFGHRIVVLDASTTRLPSVELDIVGGTTAAIKHLLALGHQRIGHLGASVPQQTFRLRERTLRRVLTSAGVPLQAGLGLYAPVDAEAARPIGRALLQHVAQPTAVFCDDDILAAGLYKGARDLGLRIPNDVSVVGFDDIALARLLEPELTTVAVPAEQLGQMGLRRLLAVLDGAVLERLAPLPLELVQRGSTGPPGDC